VLAAVEIRSHSLQTCCMTTEQLFTQALLIDSCWQVEKSSFEGEPKQLVLHPGLDPATTSLPCPECHASGCGIHDRREQSWRLLYFGDSWISHFPACASPAPCLTAGSCSYGRAFAPRFLHRSGHPRRLALHYSCLSLHRVISFLLSSDRPCRAH
jgi:hypothetical protein